MENIVKKFGKYALALFACVLLFVSGAVTDFGQLTALALDPTKAVTQAVVLLNETPKEVIVQSVKAEGESPALVVDLKPDEMPKEPAE